MEDRRDLDRRIAFLCEADRLKSVDRANVLMDLSRPENSAEHSWHVALYALVFGASDRAISMILLHDLVEIDAGVPMSVSSLRPVPPGPSKGIRKSFIPLPPWHWHGNRRENA